MPCHCSQPEPIAHSYFIVMEDHGRRGRESIVNPEETRRRVVDRIRKGDYGPINFIHWIHDGECEDVTNSILSEAGFYEHPVMSPSERLAAFHDHASTLRRES